MFRGEKQKKLKQIKTIFRGKKKKEIQRHCLEGKKTEENRGQCYIDSVCDNNEERSLESLSQYIAHLVNPSEKKLEKEN